MDNAQPQQAVPTLRSDAEAIEAAHRLAAFLPGAAERDRDRHLPYEPDTAKAALSEHGLDRHWPNARVHTLHDPVRLKFQAIGNHALNGVNPPVHSWI